MERSCIQDGRADGAQFRKEKFAGLLALVYVKDSQLWITLGMSFFFFFADVQAGQLPIERLQL